MNKTVTCVKNPVSRIAKNELFLYSFEEDHNGHKYVMYEGRYTYAQAVATCAQGGGIIAMAGDTITFGIFRSLYWMYSLQGGAINGAFLDGSNGVVKPNFSGWYCMNTAASCPTTMPWQSGQTGASGQQKCVGMLGQYGQGVAAVSCSDKLMAMCKYTI